MWALGYKQTQSGSGQLVQISCKCWWYWGKHSQRGFALTLGGASIHLARVCLCVDVLWTVGIDGHRGDVRAVY